MLKGLRLFTIGLLVASLLMLALGSCKEKPPERDTIRVGVVYSATGYGEYFGAQMKAGMLMALEEINEAGGVEVMGKMMKMELIFEDDKSSAPDAATAALKLITVDKVDVLSTCVLSACALAILPILDEYQIVGCNYAAGTPKLTDGRCFWSIRTGGHNACIITGPAVWYAKNLKPKTISILALNNEFGRTGVEYMYEVYPKLGVQILDVEFTSAAEVDYTTALTKIGIKNPDMVATIYYSPQLGMLLKQAYQMDYRPPLGFANHATGPTSSVTLDLCGWEAAYGNYGLEALYHREDYPKSLTFEEEFLEFTGGKIGSCDMTSVGGYTQVYFLADAFSRVTSKGQDLKSQQELRNSMVESDMDTLWGRQYFPFPDLGQGVLPFIISSVGKDGERVHEGVVYSEDYIPFLEEIYGVKARD